MQTFLFTIFLTLGLVSFGFSQASKNLKISQSVEGYVNENGFSGTVLVAQEGQPIFHKSYGLAYYSRPDTIQNNYHFSIASVTKLFTSIRILQLAEKGALELHQPLITYLPEYATLISQKVTIHHLLLHISGLPKEKNKVYRHRYKPAALLEQVFKVGKMNTFESFNYNNVDYVLLGLVIERLTNNPWEEEIKKHILSPIEMTETGFLAYGYYPKKFAYTYSNKRHGLQQDPLFYIENFYAAGSMYSTTLDLLKLDQALYSNELLTDESKKILSQSYPEYNYAAYGVWNYEYPFVNEQPTVMERRGGILGANVVLVRLTDDHYTIIILSNDDRFNPDSFGDSENLREILIQALY